MTTYKVQGMVTSQKTGLPVPYAKVEILKVEHVGANYQVTPFAPNPPLGTGYDTTDLNGVFQISFDFSTIPASRPSIIIRVSQTIDGGVRYIYNENPAANTRWNIGDVVVVNIRVGEECVSSNSLTPPSLSNYGFVFTRIGLIGVDKISPANGYAYPYPAPPPTTPTPLSMDSNAPFGATLHVAGWFGNLCDASVDYYRILYQRVGEPTPHEISDPLFNTYYDNGVPPTWKTVPLGPFPKVNGLNGNTVDNLYKYLKLNTAPLAKATTPWQFPDLLAAWDTTKLQDGLYTLQIECYKETSSGIVTPTPAWGLAIGPASTLKLQIDNSAPLCQIPDDGIRLGPDGQLWQNMTPVAACATIKLTAGTWIAVRFKAYDAKGHLRNYNLSAMYGHNQIVAPPPTSPDNAKDDYSAHAAAVAWNGSQTFTTEYRASGPPNVSYDSTEMPSCAYQFRLRVDKRTNNGYGVIYYDYEDTVHVTIER